MSHTVEDLLGPFIGHVTATSAMIWLHATHLKPAESRAVFVTLHEARVDAPVAQQGELKLAYEHLNTGTVTFSNLEPDTIYYYRLWPDQQQTVALALITLEPSDLRFRTLPRRG